MEILLSFLTFAVIAGGYSIKRLNDSVKSYSNSYGAEAGKIDANTHKLDEIQRQLAQSVEISESIRSDIEHGAWRERELELLKREKLEQYLLNYYDAVENLTRKMREAFFYDETPYDKSCEAKLSMLQKLYLPELDEEHRAYLLVSAKFGEWMSAGLTEQLNKRRAGDIKPVISSELLNKYPELLNQANAATLLIEAKAREIGRKINVA